MFLNEVSSMGDMRSGVNPKTLRHLASYTLACLRYPEVRLRRRHLRDVKHYEREGYLERYYDFNGLHAEAYRHAQDLANSGLIPQSENNYKTVVLSVAANFGITEQRLQQLLGNNCFVIANDLADVPRCREIPSLRSDASFLPLKPDSVDFLYDGKGALWYETERALRKRYLRDVLFLLNEYNRVLRPSRYLVVDIETSQNMSLLNLEGILLCGFTKVTLQDHSFPRIAYLKQPSL